MTNKNTTLWGLGALLAAAGGALVALFDGDAATQLDLPSLISAVLFSIALWKARDAKPTDPVVTKTPNGTVLVEQAPTIPPSAV